MTDGAENGLGTVVARSREPSELGIAFVVTSTAGGGIGRLLDIWVVGAGGCWEPGKMNSSGRGCPEHAVALFAAAELTRRRKLSLRVVTRQQSPTLFRYAYRLVRSESSYLANLVSFRKVFASWRELASGDDHPFFGEWFHIRGDECRLREKPYANPCSWRIVFHIVDERGVPNSLDGLIGTAGLKRLETDDELERLLKLFSGRKRRVEGAAVKGFRRRRRVGLLPALPYEDAISSFRWHYLRADASKVYVGREKETASLNKWVGDPKGKPYVFLCSPPGRGKSAFLVRWTETVAKRSDVRVVFHPISVRFNTHRQLQVYASLAHQLARVHGETLSPDNFSLDYFRSWISSLLRRPLPSGIRLLLVADGLDEASHWSFTPDLFPPRPDKHLRVILSARETANMSASDWLRELGWKETGISRAFSLPRLSRRSMLRAVENLGLRFASGQERDSAVRELDRLSQGEPFVVALYLESLLKDGGGNRRVDVLKRLEPGLDGFFRKWWEDHEKLVHGTVARDQVQTILDALGAALGPLLLDDLQEVVGRRDHMTGHELKAAVKVVSRFVLGDGKETGYVFSHPLLREFFYARHSMTKRDRREWDVRFVDWGRSVVDGVEKGRLSAGSVPAYITANLVGHMARVGMAPNEMSAVVFGKTWMSVRNNDDTMGLEYVSDIARVREAARRANLQCLESKEAGPVEFLAVEVKCALVENAISSGPQDIVPALLPILVQDGHMSLATALGWARRRHDVATCLLALLPLVRERDPMESRRIERELVVLAHDRPGLMIDVAVAQQKAEQRHRCLRDVIRVTEGVRGFEYAHDMAVAAMLRDVPPDEALHLVKSMLLEAIRIQTLGYVASQLPDSKRRSRLLDKALASARMISDRRQREKTLAVLAGYVAKLVSFSAAVDLLQEITGAESRFRFVAAVFAEAGLPEQLEFLRKLFNESWIELERLADRRRFLGPGEVCDAIDAIRALAEHDNSTAWACAQLVEKFGACRGDATSAVIRATKDETLRAARISVAVLGGESASRVGDWIRAQAQMLEELGSVGIAERIVDWAREVGEAMEEDDDACRAVIELTARWRGYQEALALMSSLLSRMECLGTFEKIARWISSVSDVEQALTFARGLPIARHVAYSLIAVAAQIGEQAGVRLVEEAVRLCDSQPALVRAEILVRAAKAIPPADRRRVLLDQASAALQCVVDSEYLQDKERGARDGVADQLRHSVAEGYLTLSMPGEAEKILPLIKDNFRRKLALWDLVKYKASVSGAKEAAAMVRQIEFAKQRVEVMTEAARRAVKRGEKIMLTKRAVQLIRSGLSLHDRLGRVGLLDGLPFDQSLVIEILKSTVSELLASREPNLEPEDCGFIRLLCKAPARDEYQVLHNLLLYVSSSANPRLFYEAAGPFAAVLCHLGGRGCVEQVVDAICDMATLFSPEG